MSIWSVIAAAFCPVAKTKKGEVVVKFKNDSSELSGEFVELENKNKPLYDLIKDVTKFIKKELDKETVITMIYRSKEQQDAIYGGTTRGSREYDKKPWKSPHQFWTAVDLRSKIYTEGEINKIKKYLNEKYNDSNYYDVTSLYHEVKNKDGESLGLHFHCQLA